MAMGRLPIAKNGGANNYTTFRADFMFQAPEPEQIVVTVGGLCAAGSELHPQLALRSAVVLNLITSLSPWAAGVYFYVLLGPNLVILNNSFL